MSQHNSQKWPLHVAVFEGDHDTVRRLLETNYDLSVVDPHGNTALHIATSIGCEWCIGALMDKGAPVGQKNNFGWHALHEAVSYGQRPLITRLLRKMKDQVRQKMEINRPSALQIVGQLPDFQLTVSWEFTSWVPFVNRVLPNDVCKLYKKGSRLRLESTLLDFEDTHWERGDVTILFNKDGLYARGNQGLSNDDEKLKNDAEFDDFLIIIDNRRKQYQRLRKRDRPKEIEDEVSAMMSSDIVNAHLRFDASRIDREPERRKPTNIFSSTSYRRTTVGQYDADYYEIHGLYIESRKRREHLTDVEIQQNKELLTRLAQRGEFANVKSIIRQKGSLEPPVRTIFDFSVYLDSLQPELASKSNSNSNSSSVGSSSRENVKDLVTSRSKRSAVITLGRPRKEKVQRKSVHARVAMSIDFPLSVPEFVLVLDVIAPYKKFNHLREFLLHRLPPGFPVKLDIPVFPTVSAKVVFSDFAFESEKPIADSMFEIPLGFTENPRLFPGI